MEEEVFVPSASIDSKTQPMEVRIPLLEPTPESTSNTISTTKAVVTNVNKPDFSSTIQKTPDNNEQHIARFPSTETKAPTTPYKLVRADQIKKAAFYQALLSEFIGTMLLTLVCTSTGLSIRTSPIPDLHGALASGFIVATIIVGFGHTSGAHVNPAVTVSFLIVREIDIIRAVAYIVMQLLGAICGSILVNSLVPAHAQSYIGMTMVTDDVSLAQAVLVEILITFILCYTVHAICDKKRDDIGGSKALAVGLAVTIGCLFGGPYTGGSMNPARSFGPAVIMNIWTDHWIYWVGPLLGGIIAALVYTALKLKTVFVAHSSTNLRSNTDKSNHL